MRELLKVVAAVALAEATLWGVGAWSWTSYGLRRWPWLLDRYIPIFLVVLVVTILVLRRWRLVRLHIGAAAVSGAFAGLLASLAALVLAQVVTPEDRATLWSGVKMGGLFTFLFIELSFAVLLTLGWLHGAVVSALTVGADRLEGYLARSRARRRVGPST